MNIKAIIVDDEFLARERIKKLLDDHSDITVVAEARNGDQAILEINERVPDLVFLDIQMPGKNGFEVLKGLQSQPFPIIIFTTAFDSYALQAFNVNAIDYLLKPFEQERFDEALERARSQLQLERTSALNEHIQNLINSLEQIDNHFLKNIKIKDKGREYFVKLDDVQFVESAGNYVILHTINQQYVHRATMTEMEDSLDKAEFLRIHRSYLINRRFIKSYQYLAGSEFNFTMRNGKTLRSSKSQKNLIVQFMDLYFPK